MNPNFTDAAQDVLDQLEAIASGAGPNALTAKLWKTAIEKTQDFLDNRAHDVVFLGDVGVGKSSLIGVLAALVVGASPSDRTSLKDNSVLAIGSGRTTVCEVRIRSARSGEGGAVGLLVEPFSEAEMKREIEIYAQGEWARRQSSTRPSDDDSDPTSQEVFRAIRGMTGYVEYQETFLDGNLKRRRNVRPLEDVIPRFSSAAALTEHLIERANLPARVNSPSQKEKSWWWETSTEESLTALKLLFANVNQGLEPTAMLPKRMTVVVPDPLPGSGAGLTLTLIDTRGLDGKIESRGDLQTFLRDPRTVTVLCAPFKNAPGETSRAILRSMATDAELMQALPQTLLVLLDQGDAEQVNGADGARDYGQELKIDECYLALESVGPPRIEKAQILAFDALKDDRERLLDAVDARLVKLRQAREETLAEQIKDAQTFLQGSEELAALRDLVDQRIRQAMSPHLLEGEPLRDPLAGMYTTITECRYASVVYATCRRNGAYPRLDLYAAVGAEAARAATQWLSGVITAVEQELDLLAYEGEMVSVEEHLRLRRRQFKEAQLNVIRGYANQVTTQVQELLNPDDEDNPLWAACCSEWGKGSGFKERVLLYLRGWSHLQTRLDAHERTDAMSLIPFLEEIARPAQAPRFTLHVRNLRALRDALWTPEPLSVLIGANGAGKTTLLQTLTFLRLAYERGLPEAVKIVFGGSGNLKSWGALPEEPVEIGLDLGEASWRIELLVDGPTLATLTNERFTVGARAIFSRDVLGNFTYGEERLDPSPLTGLRALMDRGVNEPWLRRVKSLLQSTAVYREPDLWTLREQGSRSTDNGQLHPRGTNALTLLRGWSQERAHRDRYQFVVEGIKAAFPCTVSDLDFKEAGTTLVANVFRPGIELPSPLANEANGVLQLLVLFCEVAAAEDESVVAIDEPENGLHPYALRRFLSRTSRWAKQHNVTVLLATHSTVLLDELSPHPEQVFVMKAAEEGEPVPTRLDKLCDPRWLAGFKLGDLYEQGEIGSNEDEA